MPQNFKKYIYILKPNAVHNSEICTRWVAYWLQRHLLLFCGWLWAFAISCVSYAFKYIPSNLDNMIWMPRFVYVFTNGLFIQVNAITRNTWYSRGYCVWWLWPRCWSCTTWSRRWWPSLTSPCTVSCCSSTTTRTIGPTKTWRRKWKFYY